MGEQRRILVVEDDRTLAETLVYNLQREGYQTDIARTGLEAIVKTRQNEPDLMLLDVMLPEIDGFDVVRTIRPASNLPIIMLSARDEEVDRVLGIELGADDYITKPFSLRELLARVRGTLRRVDMIEHPHNRHSMLVVDNLQVRVLSRTVTKRGVDVKLLPREFDLLVFLLENRNMVLSRDLLLDKVWGAEYMGEARTVDVHIRRLRAKLEENPDEPAMIQTVHGVGYCFKGNLQIVHDA